MNESGTFVFEVKMVCSGSSLEEARSRLFATLAKVVGPGIESPAAVISMSMGEPLSASEQSLIGRLWREAEKNAREAIESQINRLVELQNEESRRRIRRLLAS